MPYLDPKTDPVLHKVKCKIDSLYPILGILDGKDLMETFEFIETIQESFDDDSMPEALATRFLGLFMYYEAAQTEYHNVVHLKTHEYMRSLSACPPVIHELLSSFVTNDLI